VRRGEDSEMLDAEAVAGLFEEHRAFLWGLVYRLTGTRIYTVLASRKLTALP